MKKPIIFFLFFKKNAPIEPPPKEPPKSKNPYKIIWYKQGWNSRRVAKNNIKYWKWEDENHFKK
jgi:hypothetical protein